MGYNSDYIYIFNLDGHVIGKKQSFYFPGMDTTDMFVASCSPNKLDEIAPFLSTYLLGAIPTDVQRLG